MQTIYFETDRFIRHEGTVVDLAAYRQKLSAVSGGNWSPQFDEEVTPERASQEPPQLTILPAREEPPRPRRKARTNRLALVLDLCASLAIIALTVCAVLSFLRF